jgi:hypothetical protein
VIADRRLPVRTQVGHRSRCRSAHRGEQEDARRPRTAHGLARALRSRPHQGRGLYPASRRLHRRLPQAHRPPTGRSRLDHGRRRWCLGRLLRRHRRSRLRRRARQLRRVLGRSDPGPDLRVRQDYPRPHDPRHAQPQGQAPDHRRWYCQLHQCALLSVSRASVIH